MDPLGILWLGDAAAGPTPGAPRMCQRFVRFGFGVVSRRAVAGKTAKARVERVERVMAKAMKGSPRFDDCLGVDPVRWGRHSGWGRHSARNRHEPASEETGRQ